MFKDAQPSLLANINIRQIFPPIFIFFCTKNHVSCTCEGVGSRTNTLQAFPSQCKTLPELK